MTAERKPAPSGMIPTPHLLRSALRAGRLIDRDGTPVNAARSSYGGVPYDGLYRTEHLVEGEGVLIRAGLLREEEGVLYPALGLSEISRANDGDGCEALIVALLTRQPPLWLVAATSGGRVSSELIPDHELKILETMMDPASREALLLQLGRRFSDERQRVTGRLAEEHVVRRCRKELQGMGRADLAERVRQVSLESDQLGYDVTAPRCDGSSRRLECKGTKSQAERIVFYLSRNEADRAEVDDNWFLVACRVSPDDSVDLVGWVSVGQLGHHLPRDQGTSSRWMSVRIEMEPDEFEAGLPPIV